MKQLPFFIKHLKCLAGVAFILLSCTVPAKEEYAYEYLYADLPFEMPRVYPPVFPLREVAVTDFGGVGDGVTLNTEAFGKAIAALHRQGGGTLRVPGGIWLTGPIVFQSNINLHLEKDAMIVFTPDFDAYPLVETFFEGLATRRCQSPISGRDVENIAITGEGSINGSGEAWRPVKREKVTESHWRKIIASGGILKDENSWFPSGKSLKGAALSEKNLNVPRRELTDAQWDSVKDFMRPAMVSFVRCKNVLLQGVLLENSPSWNLHPLMCENIIIDRLLIRNPAYAMNGDGVDLESCKNALIVNSIFDAGDDGICLKSGKDAEGRQRNMPTENVVVDNCKVFNGHGGFVAGSEMSGGIRNVSVSRCGFIGTDVGLRFKSRRGRGGVVENIYIRNIYMTGIVADAFLIDLYYMQAPDSERIADGKRIAKQKKLPPVTEETPVFRNIYVNGVVSLNARRAMYFKGLPEKNISNVQVANVTISSRLGAELSEADSITFRNVRILPREGEALILNNVKNFNETNQ
ncbi:MAG: glycoside hydrolase family 28 protein [Dysgonamonadaceae bacterium]|nr:glycoside hydrolase family 28 protein [Dysgonamonadaceae bacterium]